MIVRNTGSLNLMHIFMFFLFLCTENNSLAVIPYEDQNLLAQLAKEHGFDPEEYRKKVTVFVMRDTVEKVFIRVKFKFCQIL